MKNENKVMNQQKNSILQLSNKYIKMNYYWFNRQEILQKAKEQYSKEKAAEYCKQNKEAIKESQDSIIKTCHKNKKIKLKSVKKKFQELVQYKKDALKNK